MTRIEILTAMGMSIEEATERAEQEEAARAVFAAAQTPAVEPQAIRTAAIPEIHPGGAVVRGIIDEHGDEWAEVTNWSWEVR